jgi:hypothetical protein
MECADCHALVLDESVATSEQERDSVRLAVAARAAHCAAEPLRGLWPETEETDETKQPKQEDGSRSGHPPEP